MSRKTTLFGLVVAAAIIVYLASTVVERQVGSEDVARELDEDAKDQLADEAAIAQVAAESKAIDASGPGGADVDLVQAVAPPGFVPAPPADHEPTPPEGYSFTTHHEVARGPMTAADLDREQPPADPPEWMTYGEGALAEAAAASGRDWSFGWIKLAEGADAGELGALLAAQGGQWLGQSGDLVRARLPGDPTSLEAIAASRSVAGLGAVPAERKVSGTLAERAAANINEEAPVWITLMSDDPDGRWRRALAQLGAEVGRFDPSIRTYAATIPLAVLGPVADADFVLAVESIGRVYTTLETAVPAMGADAVRSYDADEGTFVGVGGASVTVGIMDTGLNVDHPDISSGRRSICGANFANFYPRDEDQDLWFDRDQHGSHVTGIVLGNGTVQPYRVGMAPLVQDIRFAKAAVSTGGASVLAWNRAMDWFATPTACDGDDVARKALVINSSLGTMSDTFDGRNNVARKIDASVWAARQLFVTAAGNVDFFTRGLSSMASAKNALSVGAAQNFGDIATFSSRGPTLDGRLMPKVVGTGVSVASTAGFGGDGYRVLSGTSFSSPAVAGVAALVMDAVPELTEEPAAVRARLMASAIKPDAFLGDPAAFPLDNTNGPGTVNNVYGLGKVSARTAVLSRDAEDGWTGGSAAFDMDAAGHAYHDIVVPEGASRLDVVMTWDEAPAETIANTVLHDLDLWVDRGASCGDIAACGHYSSRSRVDNVEWVIVRNPPAGLYRLKVLPNRIYGPSPRAGLAWTVIRGASTPTLHVAADRDRIEVAPDEPFEVDVTVTADSYVAAGAVLRVECRAAVGSTACDDVAAVREDSAVLREDNIVRDLTRGRQYIVVGEIGPDEEQTVSLSFQGQPAGSFALHLAAMGWNAGSSDASVAVAVGGSEMPGVVRRPPNDDFAMAQELDAAGGETTFDIVSATPDPGESAYRFYGRRARERSLWYVWTAPESGLARFTVAESTPGDHSLYVLVYVYRDGPMAGLETIGPANFGGGNTFFAEEGETYRIRLSIHRSDLNSRPSALPELTLGWGPASRPDNDAYALASGIEGASGTVVGSNQGATTEPAEFMGNSSPTSPSNRHGWAGSVWFRWTAPSTGDVRFSVNRLTLVVAAFAGDDLSATRMVSGIPAREVVFPATEGAEYRIGVATGSAWWTGSEFKLSWEPGERQSAGNDDFEDAEPVSGNSAARRVAFNAMTVEPGEPVASGVRTAWWRWQPSEEGRYTWLARRPGGFRSDDAPLQMAVFSGDAVVDLETVAMDERAATHHLTLAFDAQADTAYHVSLGLPRDAAQVPLRSSFIEMGWGLTPENDDFANAAPLGAMSGSVSGSNRFATVEPGERTGTLGDSSLWWTFEPSEAAWVRFELDGRRGSKLVIYRIDADGGMEPVRISQRLDVVTATIRVEPGERYVIRFGSYLFDANSYGGAGQGEFEFSWGPTDPPARLRYVHTVVAGARTESGVRIPSTGGRAEFGSLGQQVFNADGTELYAGSAAGLAVFERDPATGRLEVVEVLEDYPVETETPLVWDAAGSALLVAACDGWLKFTAVEDGGIEYAGRIENAPCPVGDVLVAGDFVHHVMPPWMIETFRFDEGHDSLGSAGVNMIPDVDRAVMTADGRNLYGVTKNEDEYAVLAIERDAESGSLRIANIIENGRPTGPDGEAVVEGLTDVKILAADGSYLFVSVGEHGGGTLVFDLTDRANPEFLAYLETFKESRGFFEGDCERALARSDAGAVDVACDRDQYYVVQVDRDGAVYGSDLRRGFRDNRSGHQNDAIRSLAGSPDGRHLYVAGAGFTYVGVPGVGLVHAEFPQILIYERVYESEPVEESAETEG